MMTMTDEKIHQMKMQIKKITNEQGCEFCDDIAGCCEHCLRTKIKKLISEVNNE